MSSGQNCGCEGCRQSNLFHKWLIAQVIPALISYYRRSANTATFYGEDTESRVAHGRVNDDGVKVEFAFNPSSIIHRRYCRLCVSYIEHWLSKH